MTDIIAESRKGVKPHLLIVQELLEKKRGEKTNEFKRKSESLPRQTGRKR